jgi:mono/diheme cytochrome c family protein
MKAVLKALVILVAVAILTLFATFVWIGSRGISARGEPSAIETAVARTMRRLAVPRGDRDRPNPVQATPEVIAAGMSHYADHCAACHANDGSGETEIGLGLYPKPPDMRQDATQSLSDGELFYIIENGVRLTGMPAWGNGTHESAEETWHLVHFIRRLPKLTDAELEEMAAMNPRPPAETRQEIEEQRFLAGEEPSAPKATAPHVH